MASDHHQTLSVERVRRDLHSLHDLVCRNWGRVEILNEESNADSGCVLISKAELLHLENALEIFCQSPGGRAICDELTRIARESTGWQRSPTNFLEPGVSVDGLSSDSTGA
jgi:hypothetical protein